jgi:DNA polymerase-1
MKRLVLVDGHSLLHRAFHALPPLTTPDGKPIGAVYGFARMLLRIFSDLEPTYVGVAMEAKGPTFRHKEFKAYKEQRPEMDEELEAQIPRAHRLLGTLNIPMYISEGYEGEDLIASFIKKAGEKADEVVIVTGDRDLFQLVGGKVRLFVPEKGLSEGKLYGAKEVIEKLGVKPDQVIDYKALCGDPSDNIPGVRGIGKKTATRLLKEHGSLDEIYKNMSELPERVKSLLEKGKEDAYLSQKLARIVDDAPVRAKLVKWNEGAVKSEQAQRLFRELGFKTLLSGQRSENREQESGSKAQIKMRL